MRRDDGSERGVRDVSCIRYVASTPFHASSVLRMVTEVDSSLLGKAPAEKMGIRKTEPFQVRKTWEEAGCVLERV
jgi:hypothetical protein